MRKGRGPEQVKGLWEETVELEAVTWRQGLCSAGLVLGLLMEVVCSWGAWCSAVQSPSSRVCRTPSAQCLPLGQQMNECLILPGPC